MKEAYLPKEKTLLTELRNWKHTEDLCWSAYDDEALKSRSFQKLKMQTYQQLYEKYKGAGISLSTDEKVLHRMLRHQYKQIERKLYPNALVRAGMCVWSTVQLKVKGLVKGSSSQEGFDTSRIESFISSDRPIGDVESSVVKPKEQVMENSNQPERRWVSDLGRKRGGPEEGQKMEVQ